MAILSPAPLCKAATARETPTKKRSKISKTPSAYTSKIAKPTEKKFQRKFPSASPPSKSPSNDQATAPDRTGDRFRAREGRFLTHSSERKPHDFQECNRQAGHGAVPFCENASPQSLE